MDMWSIFGVALATFLLVSTAAAFVVAAILGAISHDVSAMLEAEPWTVAQPARARAAAGARG